MVLEKNLNNKIKEMKKERRRLISQIKRIKRTKECLGDVKKKEEIEKRLSKIHKEKNKLRDSIDYWILEKLFDGKKEKSKIIKGYKEDFNNTFLKDEGKGILELFEEAKVNNNNLSDKIKGILKEQEKIDNIILEKDKTDELSKRLEKINTKIKKLNLKK